MNDLRYPIETEKLTTQFVVVSLILMWSAFSWGGSDTASSVGQLNLGQIFVRVLPVLLALSYFFLLDIYRHGRAIRGVVSFSFLPLFLYALFSAAFCVFSRNPLLSLWKAIEVFAVLYWIISARSFLLFTLKERLYKLVFWVLFILIVWLLLAAFINPAEGWYFQNSFRLNGYFPVVNPNALGFYTLTLMIISFSVKKQLFKIIFVPCFVLFVLSASRSSFIALAVIMTFFVLEVFFKNWNKLVFLRILIIVVVSFLALFFLNEINTFVLRGSENYGDLSGGSGRFVIWNAGIKEIMSNFPVGTGIGSSRYLYLKYDEIRHAVSMHNSAIEIVLNAGFFGVILILCFLFKGISLFKDYMLEPSISILSRLDLMIYIILLMRYVSSSSLASFQIEVFLFAILLLPESRFRVK